MTRGRLVMLAGAGLVLLALYLWQSHRERLMAQCFETGGYWVGSVSRCEKAPGRILIERELQRSGDGTAKPIYANRSVR